MATTQSRHRGVSGASDGRVVLVTGPRCKKREGSNGEIEVEPEQFHTLDITSSPAGQKKIVSVEAQNGSGSMQEFVAEHGLARPVAQETESDEGEQVSPPRHGSTGSLADNLEDDSSHDYPFSAYVLGKSYHPVDDYATRREDESSLFWFTYRCDFPEIVPYGITTDAGWGCMLRSAQMLLAQTLKMHFQSRDWRPPPSLAKRRLDPFVRRVLTWFADFPSQSENVFSLHNMVAAGISRYQVLPGEWWGPGTVSHVLCDLCALFEEQQKKTLQKHDARFRRSFAPGDLHRPMFRVHVAPQGTVYRDSVDELMTKDWRKNNEDDGSEAVDAQQGYVPSHPLDPQYVVQHTEKPSEWDTALLLLVPLRLGLKDFNEDYTLPLVNVFSFRQSVGVLGGRPRGARYFYGANSDGSKLYALDPHSIHAAPHRQKVMTNVGKRVRIVAITEDYLQSVNTKYPEAVAMTRLDPTMTLGFYCRDRDDFEHLCTSLQKWKEEHVDMPELFAVEDAVPDYCANVSSAMNEMLMSSMSVGDGFADSFVHDELEIEDGSDEDEYVML